MDKIYISEAFRDAMRADGSHGVDADLVTEGLGSTLARFADKAAGGLFAKKYHAIRKKKDSWANSFKEAMGDIRHTISVDIERIAKNGRSPEKWANVVSGDLTKHVTHGLTGKGGMPANLLLSALKLPNGKKANDIPLAWGICCQTTLFDLIKNKHDDLPSMQDLLGTVANTINIAAYIAGAKPYGTAPYEDICSYIAAGGEGKLPKAMNYDEDKDNIFKESMVSLFQNGWRPANMQAMAGTINIICSQLFVQSFVFLADNKICAFTEQWYNANKHLWGWMEGKDLENDDCIDFDAQVKEHLVNVSTATKNGPMTDAQVAIATVDALDGIISGGVGESVVNEEGDGQSETETNDAESTETSDSDSSSEPNDGSDGGNGDGSGEEQGDSSNDGNASTVNPNNVVAAIETNVKNFQSQKTKGEFVKIKSAAKDASKDEASFDAFKKLVSEFLKSIGATNPVSDAVKKVVGKDNLPEFQEKVNRVNNFIQTCKPEPVEDKKNAKIGIRKTGFTEKKHDIPEKYRLNQNSNTEGEQK